MRPPRIVSCRFAAGVPTYPLHDWGTFFGPIGRDRTALLHTAMEHIRRTRRDWDLLDLRWTDRDGEDRLRTPRAMRTAGMPAWEEPWSSTAVVPLQGEWQDYFGAKSGRWRENVRRQGLCLAERGGVTYVRYRPRGAMFGDDNPRGIFTKRVNELLSEAGRITRRTARPSPINRSGDFCGTAHAEACAVGHGGPEPDHGRRPSRGLRVRLRPSGLRDRAPDRIRFPILPGGARNVLMMYMIRDSFQRGDRRIELGPGRCTTSGIWPASWKSAIATRIFPGRDFACRRCG